MGKMLAVMGFGEVHAPPLSPMTIAHHHVQLVIRVAMNARIDARIGSFIGSLR